MSNDARIAENYQSIVARAGEAAQRSGRQPGDAMVVAVTKYVGVELIRPLLACGCRNLGESRPQQLWDKAEALSDADVRWHLIGHLQRNKVDRTLPYVSLLHSVDSARLLTAVNRSAEKQALPRIPALLEVNVSGEDAKHGLSDAEAEAMIEGLNSTTHVAIHGLMAMASHVDDPRVLRAQFGALRALKDRFAAEVSEDHPMSELSMGMSGDFEVAIEEGATLVRVGSALFEGCH